MAAAPFDVVPRFATARDESRRSVGGQWAAVAEVLRGPLMPHQRLISDVAGELVDGDDLAHSRVVVFGPRRTGKTHLEQARCTWEAQRGPAAMWTTAQSREKARDRWLEIATSLERVLNRDDRGRLVRPAPIRITRGIGYEWVHWTRTGATLRPFAPTPKAMHGETPRLVFADEFGAHDAVTAAAVQGAYRPAFMTEWGRAQEWLLTTFWPGGAWQDEELQAGRAAVVEGRQTSTAYFEYGAPEAVGATPIWELSDVDLLEVTLRHHPAAGRIVRPESIWDALVAARAALNGRQDYLRGYCNVIEGIGGWGVIPQAVWTGAKTTAGVPDPVGVGVAIGDDGVVHIVAAGRTSEGVAVVEHLAESDALGWLIIDGVRMPAAAAVDRLGAVQDLGGVAVPVVSSANRNLVDEISTSRGGTVTALAPAQTAAAVDRLVRGVRSGTVRHHGQPVLDRAVQSAAAAGGVWSGVSGGVLSALSAAVWAADHPVEGPPRRFRIGGGSSS